ncbi:MAG: hypothetical protein GY884_35885, partial [Proteobacteria bacterium]|nr:hypothetical protein [Pseudomonadota bacterium]
MTPTVVVDDPLDPDRSGPEAAPEVAESTPEPVEREALETVTPELAAPEGVTFTEPDPEGLLFRVVHEETGAPVPRAHLIYMGTSSAMSEGSMEMLAAGHGIDAVLERFGRHYRCDDAGEVRIGDLEADSIVRARGLVDGRRLAGLLEVDKHLDDMVEVPVKLEAGFEVTVVDPAGQPVEGATAELQIIMDFDGGSMRYPVNAVTTGASGRAFLSNILLEMGPESLGMVDGDSRVAVVLSGFYGERLETDVDWQTSTPAEVRFERPWSGRVEVTVEDDDGQEFTGGYVVLGPAGERTNPDVGPPERAVFRSIQLAEDALVVFESVERG